MQSNEILMIQMNFAYTHATITCTRFENRGPYPESVTSCTTVLVSCHVHPDLHVLQAKGCPAQSQRTLNHCQFHIK